MDRNIAIQFNQAILNPESAKESIKIIINEPEYVHGPTNVVEIPIISVRTMTTIKPDDTLILTTKSSFCNASGDIHVKYTAGTNGLYGKSGVVENFDIPFTPEGLVQVLPPNPLEYFTIRATQTPIITPIRTTEYTSDTRDLFSISSAVALQITPISTVSFDSPERDLFKVKGSTLITITDINTSIP